MYNPLTEQLEELTSRKIGDATYNKQPIVLLSDATEALEELERKLTDIFRRELDRSRKIPEFEFRH